MNRPRYELPVERQRILKRALVLEWLTIGFLLSSIALLYLVMGSSQAMKTEWFEKLLSLVPASVFLVSVHFRDRPPSAEYPYGYHRAVSLAFLAASLALLAMGAFLFIDAVAKMVRAEHPTIGTVEWFGRPIWLGWLMFPVLLWTIVPLVFLGRAKLEPARQLHDKTLHADAHMNKADWLSGLAAMVGVGGIAVGWWWADAVAAAVISLDIIVDGSRHLGAVCGDLMDRRPRTVDNRAAEALPSRLVTEWKKLPWVEDAQVRMRESGHVFFGEAFLVPVDHRDLMARVEEAQEVAYALDWRLREVAVQLVDALPQPPARGAPDAGPVESAERR
jgi:cation diffusion facilitator family transporter